jgi:small subunit ribosomal protein S16
VATKIRLMRLGKMRAPYYRVVVADSRTKRDGRVIETIGKYHPKEDPSFIEIDSTRAIHWLSVGAQPTEAVEALLKVTGAWQEFKGLPAPPPMLVKAPKADKKAVFEAAHKGGADAAAAAPEEKAAKKPAKKAAKSADAPAAAEATAADEPAPAADEPEASDVAAPTQTETPEEAPAEQAPAAEAATHDVAADDPPAAEPAAPDAEPAADAGTE